MSRAIINPLPVLLPLLFSAMLSTDATAGGLIPFYAGTYAKNGKSKGIYRGELDADSGRLSSLSLAAAALNPGYIARAPNGKFLYAALESKGGGALAAFRVETDGRLTPLNELSAGGEAPCQISVDTTGRNVLAANYSGGSIACFQTKEDGSLANQTAFIQLTGSGPNPDRQKSPHAHSIYADVSNRFVYACDLGADRILVFRFDPAAGTLTPADPASIQVPPGGGPRHLAFTPDGRFVYADNEMGLSVTAFVRNAETGALVELQTLPTIPKDAATEGVTCSGIACHPSGKWLYVSNRGRDTITLFGIGKDGKLTLIEEAPALVKVPREFAIDPTGRWLIAAGQGDDKLALLAIDPETGRLRPAGSTASLGMPVCLLFPPAHAKFGH